MNFDDDLIFDQLDELEKEKLDPQIVAEFMRELTFLTRRFGVEIASFDDINPFLVKTDCRNGVYIFEDDEEMEGLFYAERSMMQ